MPGTDRVRHCSQCAKNVYNLSAMTQREAGKLLRETEGRLCARLYRRTDGTILTENCSVGLRAIGAKVSRWAGAAMAMATVAYAQVPLMPITAAQVLDFQHTISGVVQDPTGAVIPNAQITILDGNSGKKYIATSGSRGEFRIESVSSGSYKFAVEVAGFTTLRKDLTLGAEPEVKLTATMTVPAIMGEIVSLGSGSGRQEIYDAHGNRKLDFEPIRVKKHHWWQL